MNNAVGIIYNLYKTYKKDARTTAEDVAQWLETKGEEVYLFTQHYDNLESFEHDSKGKKLKYCIVFGGDGTVLYAARLLSPYGIPLLCINTGSLGFISEIPLESVYPSLDKILHGHFIVQERSMLRIDIEDENDILKHTFFALNDAVVMRNPLSYIIDLETYISSEYVTTYRADGLIISSATGSTAYSLSAGGPIMMPEVPAYIINPICPHALFNRAIVVPETTETTVKINLREKSQEVLITIDGQSNQPLIHGDQIKISRALYKTRLMKLHTEDFFHIMRTKLFLGR